MTAACLRSNSLMVVALGLLLVLTGCGVAPTGSAPSAVSAPVVKFAGRVHGGQQPVSGSQVYLYAASTTENAGPATSLLVSPGYVVSDANGNFSITGDYTCPAGAYVYLLALGGNPGLATGTNNPDLALAAGLGACSSLSASTTVMVNEVTTVAMAYSLAGYATSETNIGANNAVPNSLASAFANIPNLVNLTTGAALATTPGGGIVPQATLDSLANGLAACINSDGTGPGCSALMTAANVTGGNGTPLDTFQAILNIAQNPTLNVKNVFDLSGTNTPFQPALTAKPADWTVTIQYPGGSATAPPVYYVSISPGSATIDQEGTQTYTVSVTGSASVSGFSYQWTLANHAYGLLNEVGGAGQTAQYSYCSSSAQSNYIPNASPAVASASGDIVQVLVFTGSGCGNGNLIGSTAARVTVIPDVSTTAIPAYPTTTYSGTVVLPGSQLTPDQVSVITSVTSTTPLPSGAFTVTEYANGEQIVTVLSPAGNPMLLGWMDSTHPTVSASTTAEVLAFFALGGQQMLNESDRNQIIAGIPQESAFPALVQAITTELAANPEAFSTTDANVSAAVNTFYTAVTGLTPHVKQPGGAAPLVRANRVAEPRSVIPSPSSTTAQSGVSVTGEDPTSAYVTNAYRRRTHVFVTRESDITLGTPNLSTDDVASVTDFDVPPTVGLTGGVTGAVSDIFKAYFGTQPTAYAPISTDPFSIPVTSGFDETSYQLLNVGAGGSGAPSPVTLTNGQQAVLVATAVNGLVNDALVPFVTNVGFGSGSLADSGSAPTSAAATFQAAFIGSVQSQVLALTQSISGEQDKIVAGDYAGAANDLLWGVGATQFQNLISAAITTAASTSGFNIAPMSAALSKFNGVMKAAGAGLQAFDTSVYSAQLLNSDNVDQWTLLSAATKIKLVASTTTINGLGNSGLTVNVLGVTNTNGYSYNWSLSPAVSTNSTIGSLTEVGGAGRTGQTSFCSSSPNATYINTASAVNSLMMAQADVVTVSVFGQPGCFLGGGGAPVLVGQPASATITTDPTPNAFISPTSASIAYTGSVALAATVSVVTNTTGYSYLWTVTPVAPATSVSGNLSGVGTATSAGAGQLTYCSSSANATYQSTLTSAPTGNVTDNVTVAAFPAAGCGPSSSQLGSSATAQISTSSITLALLPAKSTISQGSSQALLAKLPSSLNLSNYSFLWTVTAGGAALAGNLSGVGTPVTSTATQLTYCSGNPNPSYVSTATGILLMTDTVQVAAFNAPGCVSANMVATTATATVTSQLAALLTPLPGQISRPIMASDGNIYAASFGGTGQSVIYQITPQGAVDVLFDFGAVPNLADGLYPSSIIEGPDGYLYGTTQGGNGTAVVGNTVVTGLGTLFKVGFDGSIVVLHSVNSSDFISGALPNGPIPIAPAGGLLLGSDGNFYGTTAWGVSQYTPSGTLTAIAQGAFLGLSRDFTYSYPAGASPTPLVQATDGNFYTSTTNLPVNVPYTVPNPPCWQTPDEACSYSAENEILQVSLNGGLSVIGTFPQPYPLSERAVAQLTEGADGNLYGEMGGSIPGSAPGYACTNPFYLIGCVNYPPGSIFDLQGGSPTSLYSFDSLAPGAGPLNALTVGPDGNLYGETSTGGDLSQCNGQGCGVIFQYKTSNSYNPIYTFGSALSISLFDFGYDASGDLMLASQSTDPTTGIQTPVLVRIPAFSKGPVQLSLSTPAVTHGSPVTLNWNVTNAFSLTAQQCYAFVQNNATGAGTWTGKQTGTATSAGYSGSATITPTAPGVYTYALTCGGVESGFATLTVQ